MKKKNILDYYKDFFIKYLSLYLWIFKKYLLKIYIYINTICIYEFTSWYWKNWM